MIRLYDFDEVRPEEILNRDIRAEADVEATVDAIIADVRARGDAALIEYAAKFDHAELTDVRVSQAEIEEAFAELEKTDPEFITTLKMAAENIRHFHEQQLHKNFVVNDKPGIVLGQKYTPIQRAGVYVPGGTAAYPSTVLMDVIPAKVAGVGQIVMTTPAGRDGKVNPAILAAAVIAGIDLIFKTGGAQAVAALAYGTESVPAVDKIVGPGNIYVATAKRKVFGKVGIDMIAGPSEILVLADGTCNPAWVAADLLSQAEHDKLASPVLVTDSWDLAKAVQAELEVQIPQLPRAAIARASVDTNGKIIVTDDMNKAIEAVNIIAPEHLEICVDDPFAVLNSVQNAGSIFLGKNVPEALGDYFAGPNHTLPTSGTARFSSPLGVDDFVKKSSFIYYTREALGEVQGRIANFAEHDKLASPVLVTDSADLAKAVQAELEVQIPQLPRAAIARASVDDNGKIIVCTDLHKAIEACNIIAPEHLEVCVEDPFGVLNEIKNAGSIFLGRNVPEALGDYFAGPNHTLPTSGTARFSSPLGVDDFVKKSSFIYYTREALGEVAPRIADFAEREGLHAHAKSVTIRYEK